VGVLVAVGNGVLVGVGDGVLVRVGDGVLVGVGDGVLVGVGDGVLVAVGCGLGVLVAVGDGVLVAVGGLGVLVAVGSSVLVGCGLGVLVAVGSSVLVGVGGSGVLVGDGGSGVGLLSESALPFVPVSIGGVATGGLLYGVTVSVGGCMPLGDGVASAVGVAANSSALALPNGDIGQLSGQKPGISGVGVCPAEGFDEPAPLSGDTCAEVPRVLISGLSDEPLLLSGRRLQNSAITIKSALIFPSVRNLRAVAARDVRGTAGLRAGGAVRTAGLAVLVRATDLACAYSCRAI
jgi:hypothetical protein